MPVRVLWSPEDGWCDIAQLVEDAGEATVVSLNGSARLFSFGPCGAFHSRVPLEGGHEMFGDLCWRRLDVLRGSPCGLTLAGPAGDHWAKGTPVRLVLAGLWPRWAELSAARATLFAVVHRSALPVPDGHPDRCCDALLCLVSDTRPDAP